MVLACLSVVKERCQGLISLMHVTLQLVELLPDNDADNEAYGLYLDQLMEIDHEHALAYSRGKITNEAIISCDVQHTPDQAPAQTLSRITTGAVK